MKVRIAVVVLFASLTGTVSFAGGGETTYNFLRNDVSARAAALGGSFIAVENDVNSLFYNPAGLSTLERRQLSFGFFKHLLDINSGYISYSQRYRDVGWIGAGINLINYGEFTRTDNQGNRLGTFGATEFALTFGYSNLAYQKIHYGASANFIYSSIADDQSVALAFDAGVYYQIEPDRVAVGASILHVGRQLSKYGETREDLPVDLKAGLALRPEHLPLLLNFSFNRLNEEETDFASRFRAFSIGGEFTLSDVVRARFGYDNEKRRDLKIGTSAGLAGFSLGAGFSIDRSIFDYAFNSLGKIGTLHRITVGTTL